MKNSSIGKRRVYQSIVDQIKIAIENKEILPGRKLPSERELASKLSVSRTSVKEAYSVLKSEGLIEIKHGSGVTLLKDGTDDVIMKMNIIIRGESTDTIELMELRQGIEGEATYYASLRCSDEDIENLHYFYLKLKKAVEAKEIAAKEDLDFHMYIARLARNSILTDVMYMISDRLLEGLQESRADTIKIPGKSQQILEEHYDIFSAIRDKQPLMAREAMYNHLQNVKQRYL